MKTKSNVEIEIRGKFSKKEFDQIFTLLTKSGKLLDHYKRVSVDLSPGFDVKSRSWKSDDQIDLRVKKSGNSEKISLKIGSFNAKKRKEIEIPLKEGAFLSSVLFLENLGFNSGMVYFLESWEFLFEGFEVKISKYTNDYHTWEIESKDSTNPSILAKKLKLSQYTKTEYQNSINWENKNIHNIYSYKLVSSLVNKSFGTK